MNIELKVITTTVVSLLVGVGVAVGNAVEANHALLGSLGPTYQAIILAIAPALITAGAGYMTRHTPRPDLAGTPPAATPPQT